jgi:hypothetical protein
VDNWEVLQNQVAKSGAGNRSRTYDLRITNALLYQLSYAGVSRGVFKAGAILTE